MANARDDVNSLRNKVKQRQRGVGKKISRAKSTTGAVIAGTEYDPRLSVDKIGRYNSVQLNAHLSRLDSFMSRNVQFVADSENRPIARHKWQQYKRAERNYNRQTQRNFSKYADIPLSSSGMTVRQRMEMMTPKFQYMQDRAVNSPFMPVDRKSQSIRSEKTLETLTKNMRSRVGRDHVDKMLADAKKQFNQIMDLVDAPKLKKMIGELSDNQFDLLWNYTGFATSISLGYEIRRDSLKGIKKAWHGKVWDDSMSAANELAGWAKRVRLDS